MIGPSHLADGAISLALIVLHFVVAIVVITGFAATLPAWRDDAGRKFPWWKYADEDRPTCGHPGRRPGQVVRRCPGC